tara:strand:- start:115 stop:570 length:456 start_codon:yes stop_codon:yes gene_type:complete
MLIYETVVKKTWIDYNGHMNVAFYYNAFEMATLELWAHIGIDNQYRTMNELEFQMFEGHIQFIKEAKIEEKLRIESKIFRLDTAGLLVGQEMFRGKDLLCRFGQWSTTVDTPTGQVRPIEDEVWKYGRELFIEKNVELPAWLSRRISINRG